MDDDHKAPRDRVLTTVLVSGWGGLTPPSGEAPEGKSGRPILSTLAIAIALAAFVAYLFLRH